MRQSTTRRALVAAIALCSALVPLAASAFEPAAGGVEFGQPAPALPASDVSAERFDVLFGNRAEQHAALYAARAALAAKDAELTARKADTERQASELAQEKERLMSSFAAESASRAELTQQVERLAANYEQAKLQLEAGQAERSKLAAQVAAAESRLTAEAQAAESARAEAAAAKAEIAAAQAAQAKLTKFEIKPEDKTVRDVLERWARGAGYELAWTIGPENNWTIEFGGAFGDHFPSAVDALIVGVNQFLANARGRSQPAQLLGVDIHPNGIVRIYFTQSAN